MELEELITKFCEGAGLEGVSPMNGVWKFSADGNVFGATADESGENVWLFGEINGVNPEKKDALVKAAMEANYFHRGTAGATFSLNPDTGALTLVASRNLDALDDDAFFAFIETFVNSLSVWNGIAAGASADPAAPAQPTAAPADAFTHHGFMQV